jgi:hypothetical protein
MKSLTRHWTGSRATQPPFSSAVARPVSLIVKIAKNLNKNLQNLGTPYLKIWGHHTYLLTRIRLHD